MAVDIEEGMEAGYLRLLAWVLSMPAFYSAARHKVTEISIETVNQV